MILLLDVSLYSQIVNIQPFLKETKKNGFSATFKGALDWKTGNTELIKTDLALALKYIKNKHLFLILSQGGFAELKSQRVIAKTFEHLRYRYQIIPWLGIEVFGQYEYNEFKRIDIRTLGGIGPRFTKDLGKIKLSLGSAYMLEFNRNATGSYSDSGLENTYHRWSNYLNIDIQLGNNLEFFSTFYIQPRWDEFSDYRLLNDNSLIIKANETFNFILSAIISYDSKPLDGIKSLDTSLTSAISISINE